MSEQVAAWFGDAKSSCAQVSNEAERRQEGFETPVVGGRSASCHTWIFVTAAKGSSGGLLCEQGLWQVTRRCGSVWAQVLFEGGGGSRRALRSCGRLAVG